MLVLQYAPNGDLRHYLRDHFTEITWKRRLFMLNSLANNISAIHNAGFTHYDLHPGNVLIISEIEPVISDFGLARHRSDALDSKVYGVMPYVAPEVLKQQLYSEAADIYAFSMLMWEICSGKRPFSKEDHDAILSDKICQGLRPEIAECTPKCFTEVMKLCWDEDPTKRPTSTDLYKTFYSWLNEPTVDVQQQFEAAEKHRQKTAKYYDAMEANQNNPGAIYYSRLLSTEDSVSQALSMNI